MTIFNAIKKLEKRCIQFKRDTYDDIVFQVNDDYTARGRTQDGHVIYWCIEDVKNPDQPQFDNFTTVYEKSLSKVLARANTTQTC